MKILPLATFSPSGSTRAWQSAPHPTLPLLATSTADRTARIYSLSSFRLHSTVSGGHKRSIRSSAWQPGVTGEAVLATGSFDSSVGIWRRWDNSTEDESGVRVGTNGVGDDEEEEEEWRFSIILDGHDAEVKSVAFSAGGQFLATCARDKTVWVWEELDPDNWETVAVLNDHEQDVKCVAWHPSEDLLASGSYDDSVRLHKEDSDDWVTCAVLTGHGSTVWCVGFEPLGNRAWVGDEDAMSEKKKVLVEEREQSGPRLISCSDDQTIRIWKRRTKARASLSAPMPSIIRTGSVEEDWAEESQLPKVHDRAIYSVAWSAISGRVVSTGSDGRIVVYEEQWKGAQDQDGEGKTVWKVIAQLEDAHGVYEVNHVCWTKRRDKDRRSDDEMIITTGDDGEVRAWILGI
jgi:cytosolic iron-sulfur protein assembly protein CIAO1